jgi:hypothetical protein
LFDKTVAFLIENPIEILLGNYWIIIGARQGFTCFPSYYRNSNRILVGRPEETLDVYGRITLKRILER